MRLILAALLGAVSGAHLARLPGGPLLVSYATTSACEGQGGAASAEKIVQSVRDGVNVVIWFAVNLGAALARGGSPQPAVLVGNDSGLRNISCVALVAARLEEEGLGRNVTAHMVSIGGWDAPHPDTRWTGAQWWGAWREWNSAAAAAASAATGVAFAGFDGIDWDLEGNDAPASRWNAFTPACVRLVGEMSVAAKRDGFLVSLVPPESYLDVSTGAFDLSLSHAYDDGWQPAFKYHGHNGYAAFLAGWGQTCDGASCVPTFDFVAIQLYESFSHAGFAIDQRGEGAAEYLARWAAAVEDGWTVHFNSSAPGLLPGNGSSAAQTVRVPAPQLVVGLARGDGQGKSLFVWPRDVGRAFAALEAMGPGRRPRGVMFFYIEAEGRAVNGTDTTCSLAPALNAFLHVRAGGGDPSACVP